LVKPRNVTLVSLVLDLISLYVLSLVC